MIPFVLGEEEVVLGFSLIGVKGCVAREPREAAREFDKALECSEKQLLLVSGKVADWLRTEIRTAVLRGALVQVIPSLESTGKRGVESEALLLSELGIKW